MYKTHNYGLTYFFKSDWTFLLIYSLGLKAVVEDARKWQCHCRKHLTESILISFHVRSLWNFLQSLSATACSSDWTCFNQLYPSYHSASWYLPYQWFYTWDLYLMCLAERKYSLNRWVVSHLLYASITSWCNMLQVWWTAST